MRDPILQAHERAPLFFSISGVFSPISIRDQMFRAQALIDRAAAWEMISPRRPLLVVGAGAAGVTAAMQAAAVHRVRTMLVEQETGAFLLQGSSQSRWLDPYLYDYPIAHWTEKSYPLVSSPAVPLPWSAGYSRDVAQKWEIEFANLHKPIPQTESAGWSRLTFSRPDKVISRTPVGGARGHWEVQTKLMQRNNLPGRKFGMILACVGFPPEKRTVGAFTGRAFWDSDTLLKPDFGLAQRKTVRSDGRPTLVISGAGDGALQDVLRASTGAVSARHILDHLKSRSLEVPDQMLRHLSDAEDQANRAYSWSTPEHNRDHKVLDQLQKLFEQRVQQYTNGRETKLRGALAELVQMRGPSMPMVHLVHCCSHFSQSYGVNRFLVILMAKLLPDVVQCHKGCAVNKVESHDAHTHVCDLTQANACNYAPHVVHIQKNAECIFQDKRAAFRTIEADLVIVRHGPDFKKASAPLPRPRHLLPYYLAWER